jgi:predicted outer membrane repeat protein
MKRNSIPGSKFTLVIVLLVLSFHLPVWAEYLPIQNPGFEDQALTDGNGVTGVINSWDVDGTAGVFNWAASLIPDEASEGENTAFFNGGGEISQILLDNVQADSVYSLILEIGDRFITNFGGYTVELRAGATVIASINHSDPGAPIPPDGGFTTVTVNYEVQPADPVIGSSLNIFIGSPGTQTELDAVRLVRLDNTNAIENLTSGAKFASIQAAVEAAINGEIIEIAPGTYHEHVDLKGKSITLRSRSGDPNDTIIDGRFIDTSDGGTAFGSLDGMVVLCNSNEDPNTVIDGLTISNGNGRYINSTSRQGGGMYVNGASPTVQNCRFNDNSVGFGSFQGRGGGAYLRSSHATFSDCIFTLNQATVHGGGMYFIDNGQITLSNCNFNNNTATNNGGAVLMALSDATINNCSFDTNNTIQLDGGAISNDRCSLAISDSTFINNSANDQGGAIINIDNSASTIVIQNTDFIDNTAGNDGGAIHNFDGSSPTILNCDFIGNEATSDDGGAIDNLTDSSPILQNCRFVGNQAASGGGAIQNNGNCSPTILHCDFSGNRANSGGAIYNWTGSDTHIAYSSFIGNRAAASTGAILNINSSGRSQPVFDHCLFMGNSAPNAVGAVNNNDFADARFSHCTFTANSAGGSDGTLLIDNSNVEIHNCILWANNDAANLKVNANATANVSHCNIEGGFAGVGNIDADPMFVALPNDGGDGYGDDPTTAPLDESVNDDLGDQHLAAGSPSIDAGNSLFSGSVDLDGNNRAVDDFATVNTGFGVVEYVDMGVFEFNAPPAGGTLGDLNVDGIVNLEDFVLMAINWLE